jgi:dimethylhistidine N-methyltransferase
LPQEFALHPIHDPGRTPTGNFHWHERNPGPERFAQAVLAGLAQPQKAIPFRFLYDTAGSQLFDQICRQPEYYPTRTETAILRAGAAEMAAMAGPGARLVEFGSGSSEKARLLIEALETPSGYIPVDISREALRSSALQAARDYPVLPVHAVWADFARPFPLPLDGRGPAIGFFPGSSIGNFSRPEARHFLAGWRAYFGPDGGMIVGVDLIKPVAELEAAYNDSAGVTAAFSTNLLRRINRELGGDFKLSGFRHEARYNSASFAVDIHLVSLARQEVSLCGRTFVFEAGERLHVESSHKYDIDGFQALARAAGYRPGAVWVDPAQRFSVHFLFAASPGDRRPEEG